MSDLMKNSAMAQFNERFSRADSANMNSNAGQSWWNQRRGIQDVNASTETAYPMGINNSMNKKLEAAKKYLKNRFDKPINRV